MFAALQNDDFNVEIQYDKNYDFTITANEFDPNAITKEAIQEKYKTQSSATSNIEKRLIHLVDFQKDQHPGK